MPILAMTPDIMSISRTATRDTVDAAKAFYAVTKLFKMGRLEHLAHSLSAHDYFDGLAQNRALDTMNSARLAITNAALGSVAADQSPDEAVSNWLESNQLRIARVQDRIADLTTSGDLTVSRLTVAAGLLADLVS